MMQSDQQESDYERQAWSRFERAVDAAIKGGPKHRPAPVNKKARPTSKGRVHKGKTRS
jgi:hypothetical protein